MTLTEMALEYRANCERIRLRMRELKEAMAAAEDPVEQQILKQRIADLTVLYREGREVALHLERYYDRRYYTYGKFTF